MQIEVTRDVIEAMRRAASVADEKEACGILLGQGAQILKFIETRNVHPSPDRHFEIDPQALIAAHKEERAGGPQLLGYFHSHPNGKAMPSQTDRDCAAHDGKIWAIAAGYDVTFWRDEPDRFQALSFSVIAG
ncbi:MAG: M67 family metallopeptidase [Pseudomonadota bacterium]